jgi:hypothetical protein
MNAWSSGLLVLALCALNAPSAAAAPPPQSKAQTQGLAPDGRRGFGVDVSQRDVSRLWRSKDAGDRAFLEGLNGLSVNTRVALFHLRAHYIQRGYFKFLDSSQGDDLSALYRAYGDCFEAPARMLAAGGDKAVALAAMLIDTRFNVRRQLVADAELALREQDRALAVLAATVFGYTSLLSEELESVAARADLAAAELRALRQDLEVLTPGVDDKLDSRQELELQRTLLDLGKLPDEGRRTAMVFATLEPRRELERRMQPFLFSTRIEPQLRKLRDWRARALTASAERRTRVLEMIPDISEGQSPPPEIARLGKSQRMRIAAEMAIEGLVGDPLEPDLAWAAGHARGFFAPGRDELIYMDRYLALMGLRYGEEASPGRELTPRELEALEAVRRSALK